MTPRTLGYGRFFGDFRERLDVAGFSLARITAARPPASVPEHAHETGHVVLVTGGDYETQATRLEPGRAPVLVYNPPGTTHRDRFGDNDGAFFTLSVSDRRLDSLGTAPDRAIGVASGPAVRLARRLLRLCEASPTAARLEASCHELLRALFDDARRGGPRPPGWLLAARDTIATHYDEALSVGELAATAAIHPVHLIRAYRRFFGATPAEDLRNRRLEAAATLLATTRLPIVEVALRTGFADQSHLTRAFTRRFAQSPGAYRRSRAV